MYDILVVIHLTRSNLTYQARGHHQKQQEIDNAFLSNSALMISGIENVY